jgi:hypothetical protein
MDNDEGIDRRATGMNRVIMTNDNGDRTDTIQINVERAKIMMNFLKALAALLIVIGGAVWGGVRWGISAEVHSEVETAIADECAPGGKIDTHVKKVAAELVDEFQEIVEDDIATASIERQIQHDLGIRLEERQIALTEKMAEDKADLIREIRRVGDPP